MQRLCGLLLVLFVALACDVKSQCTSRPGVSNCSGGNGSAGDGQNINGGEFYWFNGNATFPSGVNLNGGTFTVCGTLTLSNLNFNGGSIVVRPGGILIINGTGDLFLNGNCTILNQGSLTINRSIRMQNANNLIYNDDGAFLDLQTSSSVVELNSSTSTVVNRGHFLVGTLFIQGSAAENSVCFTANSCLDTEHIINNRTNSINVTGGQAAITFSVSASLNSNLTNDSDLVVCRGSGTTTSGGAGFGSANVMTNCPDCSTALPVELVSFSGTQQNSTIALQWTTASEIENESFVLQHSSNLEDWEDFANIPGAGNSTQPSTYSARFDHPVIGTNYFRIKQVDFDGDETIHQIIAVNFRDFPQQLVLSPNPARSYTSIQVSELNHFKVFNMAGQDVTSQVKAEKTEDQLAINIQHLTPGIYFIQIDEQMIRLVKTAHNATER